MKWWEMTKEQSEARKKKCKELLKKYLQEGKPLGKKFYEELDMLAP